MAMDDSSDSGIHIEIFFVTSLMPSANVFVARPYPRSKLHGGMTSVRFPSCPDYLVD